MLCIISCTCLINCSVHGKGIFRFNNLSVTASLYTSSFAYDSNAGILSVSDDVFNLIRSPSTSQSPYMKGTLALLESSVIIPHTYISCLSLHSFALTCMFTMSCTCLGAISVSLFTGSVSVNASNSAEGFVAKSVISAESFASSYKQRL